MLYYIAYGMIFEMHKNKHEELAEPLTPTRRAEVLREKAEAQFSRLLDGLVGGEVSDVKDVTLGSFVVFGSDPYKSGKPIIVSEGELGELTRRYSDKLMQRVSIKREFGQCDFSAWLDPVRVDAYSADREASIPVASLRNSIDGPTINGYPVETVDEIDNATNSGTQSTLTRLEGMMSRLEEATIIKFQEQTQSPKF